MYPIDLDFDPVSHFLSEPLPEIGDLSQAGEPSILDDWYDNVNAGSSWPSPLHLEDYVAPMHVIQFTIPLPFLTFQSYRTYILPDIAGSDSDCMYFKITLVDSCGSAFRTVQTLPEFLFLEPFEYITSVVYDTVRVEFRPRSAPQPDLTRYGVEPHPGPTSDSAGDFKQVMALARISKARFGDSWVHTPKPFNLSKLRLACPPDISWRIGPIVPSRYSGRSPIPPAVSALRGDLDPPLVHVKDWDSVDVDGSKVNRILEFLERPLGPVQEELEQKYEPDPPPDWQPEPSAPPEETIPDAPHLDLQSYLDRANLRLGSDCRVRCYEKLVPFQLLPRSKPPARIPSPSIRPGYTPPPFPPPPPPPSTPHPDDILKTLPPKSSVKPDVPVAPPPKFDPKPTIKPPYTYGRLGLVGEGFGTIKIVEEGGDSRLIGDNSVRKQDVTFEKFEVPELKFFGKWNNVSEVVTIRSKADVAGYPVLTEVLSRDYVTHWGAHVVAGTKIIELPSSLVELLMVWWAKNVNHTYINYNNSCIRCYVLLSTLGLSPQQLLTAMQYAPLIAYHKSWPISQDVSRLQQVACWDPLSVYRRLFNTRATSDSYDTLNFGWELVCSKVTQLPLVVRVLAVLYSLLLLNTCLASLGVVGSVWLICSALVEESVRNLPVAQRSFLYTTPRSTLLFPTFWERCYSWVHKVYYDVFLFSPLHSGAPTYRRMVYFLEGVLFFLASPTLSCWVLRYAVYHFHCLLERFNSITFRFALHLVWNCFIGGYFAQLLFNIELLTIPDNLLRSSGVDNHFASLANVDLEFLEFVVFVILYLVAWLVFPWKLFTKQVDSNDWKFIPIRLASNAQYVKLDQFKPGTGYHYCPRPRSNKDTTEFRDPMQVKTFVAQLGFCSEDYAPVAFASNAWNEEQALRARICKPTLMANKLYRDRVFKWLANNDAAMYQVDGKYPKIHPVSFAYYIEHTNATPATKRMLWRTWQRLKAEGITVHTHLTRKQLKMWCTRKSFVKVENNCYRSPLGIRNKAPRLIQGASPELICLLGPWMMAHQMYLKHLWGAKPGDDVKHDLNLFVQLGENLLKKYSEHPFLFSSGLTSQQVGHFVSSQDPTFLKFFDDIGQFDASVDEEWLKYKRRHYARLGAPRVILDILWFSLNLTGRTSNGFSYFCEAMVPSGNPDTSSGNGIINVASHLAIYALDLEDRTGIVHTYAMIKDKIWFVVAGDDNVGGHAGEPINWRACMAKLGFDSEATYVKDLEDMEFCSNHLYHTDKGWEYFPKPGKFLSKAFYLVDPPLDQLPLCVARGIALGNINACNPIPPMRAINNRILELTSHVPVADMTAYNSIHSANPHKLIYTKSECTPAILSFLERKYQWTDWHQSQLEAMLPTMQLGDSFHGLLDPLFDVDTLAPQQYVMVA